MASPQLENGYTKISNELLDVLACSDLLNANGRVFMFIMRYTYGFNKKEHKMTASFIAEGTQLSERSVKYALANLRKMNVINRANSCTGIQKDWELWITKGANSCTVQSLVRRGAKLRQKGVQGLSPNKEKEKRKRKKGFCLECNVEPCICI